MTAGNGEARMLVGHTGYVRNCAFSPDGNLLATASWDGTARLWDPASGDEVRTLSLPEIEWDDCAFSPDGTLLATVGRKPDMAGMVQLWDPASGSEVRTIPGPTLRVESCAFSPDGKMLATTAADNVISVFDPTSGNEVHELFGKMVDCAFSPDGSLLAAVSPLRVWDPATGQELPRSGNHGFGPCCAFSPDGSLLAAPMGGGLVELLNPADASVVRTLRGHTEMVEGCAFSPDGALFATGSVDGTARLWDPASGDELRTLSSPDIEAVVACAFSPDGSLLATAHGGADTAGIWSLG